MCMFAKPLGCLQKKLPRYTSLSLTESGRLQKQILEIHSQKQDRLRGGVGEQGEKVC